MNNTFPVYTVSAECQDCYKCLRQCPVKAIKVANGRAAVIPDACIACGRCVEVCPAQAKRIRDDLGRAKQLLRLKKEVYVSLAPSFSAAFPGVQPSALICSLKKLGFQGVSETALGAELVNARVSERLKEGAPRLHLSTACPVAVDYICKYKPDLADALTPLLSPMLAHGKWLRQTFHEEIGVVFVGPCIAKKCEADAYGELVDVALTFEELARWLDEENLQPPAGVVFESHSFTPKAAREGALYPMVGGMNESLRLEQGTPARLLSVAGLRSIRHALDGLNAMPVEEPVFLELLACAGGCVGGPCVGKETALVGELAIRQRTVVPERPSDTPDLNLEMPIGCDVTFEPSAHPQMITEALGKIGKTHPEHELNCGGCGYDTCRLFAEAFLSQKAEQDMCLSYLRKRAQKKANALLRCMPSGVVIVDDDLKIIECNENFANIAGFDAQLGYAARPGMEGADLKKLLPFHALFQQVLESGQEVRCEAFRAEGRLLHLTLFPIEPQKTVGGIFLDVTQTENRRESIAMKAREVIDKNMSTVQEIACKLGEHMADTEILLRSIAEDYADAVPEGPHE